MKSYKIVSILAALVLLAGTVVAAEEEKKEGDEQAAAATEETQIWGEQTLDITGIDSEGDEAKRQEFADETDGVHGKTKVASRNNKNGYYSSARAKVGTENDSSLSVRVGKQGKVALAADYKKAPHHFASDAQTLYGGVGTANLELPDGMQADLAATPAADRPAKMLNMYLPAVHHFAVESFRERGNLELRIAATDPVQLTFGVKKERKSGTRPMFASFGFGNTIEVPLPVEYSTLTPSLTAAYATSFMQVSLGYTISQFDNRNDAFTWDDPYRADTFGRLAPPPDNEASMLKLTAAFNKIPGNSALMVVAAMGENKQDEKLQAYTSVPTTITGTELDASDPANLPADSANAKVDTKLYQLRFTSHPVRLVSFTAGFRRYEYENKSEHITFPGNVRMDGGTWTASEASTEPISRTFDSFKLGADLHLTNKTAVQAGYELAKIEREGQEVEQSDENIFRLGLSSRPADWFFLRTSLSYGDRTGDYDFRVPFEHLTGNPPQLPWLRKYDQADRKQTDFTVITTASPNEFLRLNATINWLKNDFADSSFGLLDDQTQGITLGLDWSPAETVSLMASVAYDNAENNQKARQWTPNGPADPYTGTTDEESPSNWTAKTTQDTTTLDVGLRWGVSQDVVDLNLGYTYSTTDGQIDIASAVGGTTDTNNFRPANFSAVDDADYQRAGASVDFHAAERVTLTFGVRYEELDLSDYNLNGVTLLPLTKTGGSQSILTMNTLSNDFEASSVFGALKVGF
ncbi:MAG: MtrB/PioB family decaheme-associated outer membrane protein [Candidatus Schekmanbacteria bacterium]|nr:MtrB/PioB family decaheme-associated outer membrane protein [Candidatus Schekmanbacteria bacterium]